MSSFKLHTRRQILTQRCDLQRRLAETHSVQREVRTAGFAQSAEGKVEEKSYCYLQLCNDYGYRKLTQVLLRDVQRKDGRQ